MAFPLHMMPERDCLHLSGWDGPQGSEDHTYIFLIKLLIVINLNLTLRVHAVLFVILLVMFSTILDMCNTFHCQIVTLPS